MDYYRFLTYAHASCDETREHLDLLFETGSLSDEKIHKQFKEELEILSRKLNKFMQAFKA